MEYFSKIYQSSVGPLLLISDENNLCMLKFYQPERNFSRYFYKKKINNFSNKVIDKSIIQLDEYFLGKRRKFDIPIKYIYGTDFQKKVWNELKNVEYGETKSYSDIAKSIKNPKAYRAVGNANNKNPISIIVPCHRIISNIGDISGYGGGIEKKKFLLSLELKAKL